MTVIDDMCRQEIVRFREIKVGEIFKRYDSVYLKIRPSYSATTNAFDLSDKKECTFAENDLVQEVDATITIESCR